MVGTEESGQAETAGLGCIVRTSAQVWGYRIGVGRNQACGQRVGGEKPGNQGGAVRARQVAEVGRRWEWVRRAGQWCGAGRQHRRL